MFANRSHNASGWAYWLTTITTLAALGSIHFPVAQLVHGTWELVVNGICLVSVTAVALLANRESALRLFGQLPSAMAGVGGALASVLVMSQVGQLAQHARYPDQPAIIADGAAEALTLMGLVLIASISGFVGTLPVLYRAERKVFPVTATAVILIAGIAFARLRLVHSIQAAILDPERLVEPRIADIQTLARTAVIACLVLITLLALFILATRLRKVAVLMLPIMIASIGVHGLVSFCEKYALDTVASGLQRTVPLELDAYAVVDPMWDALKRPTTEDAVNYVTSRARFRKSDVLGRMESIESPSSVGMLVTNSMTSRVLRQALRTACTERVRRIELIGVSRRGTNALAPNTWSGLRDALRARRTALPIIPLQRNEPCSDCAGVASIDGSSVKVSLGERVEDWPLTNERTEGVPPSRTLRFEFDDSVSIGELVQVGLTAASHGFLLAVSIPES